MDIIAAHQHGLIEQLDDEVLALAGRVTDHAQRAMVLHHLYDHSRGNHVWALAEARQSLRIASGIARLERRIARWGWTVLKRDQAVFALEQMADAIAHSTLVFAQTQSAVNGTAKGTGNLKLEFKGNQAVR